MAQKCIFVYSGNGFYTVMLNGVEKHFRHSVLWKKNGESLQPGEKLKRGEQLWFGKRPYAQEIHSNSYMAVIELMHEGVKFKVLKYKFGVPLVYADHCRYRASIRCVFAYDKKYDHIVEPWIVEHEIRHAAKLLIIMKQ